MRQSSTVLIALVMAAGLPACATKGYVNRNVKTVDDKVETLSGSLEETQARTKKNEEAIGQVDKNMKRLVFTVVLSDDEGNFKSGDNKLPEEAKAKIDSLVTQLKADPKGAFFEIEGHTDSVGPKEFNEKLGLERAEAVKRYLYEQHQIPLHKMNVISYGEDKPVAPNKTKAGRAQNRRVVIKVLA